MMRDAVQTLELRLEAHIVFAWLWQILTFGLMTHSESNPYSTGGEKQSCVHMVGRGA